MQETLDAFVKARLLTTSQNRGTTSQSRSAITVEVSHEAVIREWKRLAEWLHEARDDILFQQDLSKDAVRVGTAQASQEIGSIMVSQLKEAQTWAKRNRPSEREQKFLRASTAQRTHTAYEHHRRRAFAGFFNRICRRIPLFANIS